jgi:hypothetical protein
MAAHGVETAARRGAWKAPRRTGRLPFISVGIVLVLASVVLVAWLVANAGHRVQVLQLARDVPAGQAITAQDLTTTPVAADSSVALIGSGQESEIVGRVAVVPLTAGTLLHAKLFGTAAYPPTGQVIASVALRPGHYPQGVSAGATVTVYVANKDLAQTEKAAADPKRFAAVVLGVDEAGDGQGSSVITVQIGKDDAHLLAAAATDAVTIVQSGPGER